ncbi:MAG: helix-turn-helix domain-containing protein [Gaiella sp.]|nr:helix-turn-helix domain-containing protein [Gaiella sp.]
MTDGGLPASLGYRIRRERKQQRKTLRELADACGISTSFLSQIERDQAKPSVGTLHRIADVLDVTIADLFVEPAGGRRPRETSLAQVTRADQRKALVYPNSGIRNELLTPDLRRAIQMMWVVIPPGEGTGDEPLVHDGEECGLVLQGEIEVFVGEGPEQERHVLTAGDAIYQRSTIPHRSRNIGTTDAIVVTAITPPSF